MMGYYSCLRGDWQKADEAREAGLSLDRSSVAEWPSGRAAERFQEAMHGSEAAVLARRNALAQVPTRREPRWPLRPAQPTVVLGCPHRYANAQVVS